MYNEILRIASKDISSYPWATYVPNNFSEEQINVFKFILNAFPENVLISDGKLNSDVISVLAMVAYDIGESRSFINNLKISHDLNELYNSVETNRLLSSEPLEENARIGDAYIHTTGEKEILRRYVGFTWDEGSTLTKSSDEPTTPEVGDYWYNASESKLYTYTGSVWEEVTREIFFKPPKKPNYNDLWVSIDNEKVYKYTATYWEEVPLYKNNMKLLVNLLKDMNFAVLDEARTLEEQTEIIQNYELLAKDSYKIIKNRGTIKTIERIVSSFIRNENDNTLVPFSVVVGDGSHAFLNEPSDNSPLEVGTILIDIPDIEDNSNLAYLLDSNLGTDLGASTYTILLKKDNYLYKSLMKVKPAGIRYLLVSSGNASSSHSVILNQPELTFISADYGDSLYTIRVKNPNSYPARLHLVDYDNTDDPAPSEYSTIIDFSKNESRTITRVADNSQFSTNGNTTIIKAYLQAQDGSIADSDPTAIGHLADSQLKSIIPSVSKNADDTTGYVTVSYENLNDITVDVNVTLTWSDSAVETITESIDEEQTIIKRYDNPLDIPQDLVISTVVVDPAGVRVSSTTETVSVSDISGIPELNFDSTNLTVSKELDTSGGFVRAIISNPNPISVIAESIVNWTSGSFTDDNTIPANDEITVDYDNETETLQNLELTVSLSSSDLTLTSPSATKTISSVKGSQLGFPPESLTVTKGSDDDGGYIDVTINNPNSRTVEANITVNWQGQSNQLDILTVENTNTRRFRSYILSPQDVGVDVILTDPNSIQPDSITQSETVLAVEPVEQLLHTDIGVTINKYTDGDGGYITITVDNPNNELVDLRMAVDWSLQATEQWNDTIEANSWVRKTFRSTETEVQDVITTSRLETTSGYKLDSDDVTESITGIAAYIPTYVKAFDYLGSDNSSTFITTDNYQTTIYRTIFQGCIAADSTEYIDISTYEVGDIIRLRVMIEDPDAPPLYYSDCNPAYRWFEVIEVLEE